MITNLVAKTLVFNDTGDVLLLMRSDNDTHRPGGYDLPGGGVDHGEELAAAAVREAMEEAGLKLRVADLRLGYAYTTSGYHDEDGEVRSMVWLGFMTRLPAGSEIRLSKEHKSYLWLSLPEAANTVESRNQTGFLTYVLQHGINDDLWRQSAQAADL